MKKIVTVFIVAALAACGEEEAPAPAPSETVAAAPAPTRDWPGTYEIQLPDGTSGTSEIMADGTYHRVVADIAEDGTWKDDGTQFCFDPEGDLKPNRCYNMDPLGEDNVFQAHPVEGGDPVIAKKVA